nr:PREDICTED: dynein heavy chain 8, axonemal-like [Latimeria chalumnae]|eukprot:XP_014354015.1 PREDICTED: dynein heavy chain 8, axonemal-like [Latimeria chalumnae]
MVTACKAYISNSGKARVWEQDTTVVIKKMQDCIVLFREYQRCFQKTKKQTLETPGEKPFEVSEMYIFGKFEAFAKRIEKITEMITAVQTFSALGKSTIEGIDVLATKFQSIYQNVKKKQYDILDPRKAEFETDFIDFGNQIYQLEVQMQNFLSSCFTRILSSQQALQLLKRFQRLNMSCLQSEIATIVGRILQHYVAELEATKKLYQANKEDPPLARNMPPVAGKIVWARQLFQKIHEPIDYFHKNSDILSSPEGRSVVRMYNKIAYVLVEFEVLYHRAWVKEVSQLQYALQATLLVRHPETKKMLVNFDPKILEIIREAKCMIKMGLEVPDQAKRLIKIERKMKTNKLRLETLLLNFELTRQGIPAVLGNLMTPKTKKVESVLRQGLTLLNWSSLMLENFFQEVELAMDDLKQLLKQVNDICEMNIDAVLAEMASTVLIDLPEDSPCTVEEMLSHNETRCKEYAEILDHKSRRVEDAVKELISIFEKLNEAAGLKKTQRPPAVAVDQEVAYTDESAEQESSSFSDLRDEAQESERDDFKKFQVVEIYGGDGKFNFI